MFSKQQAEAVKAKMVYSTDKGWHLPPEEERRLNNQGVNKCTKHGQFFRTEYSSFNGTERMAL